MDLLHVAAEVLGALECFVASPIASSNGAWVGTGEVSLHVALEISLPVEQVGRGADAALKDLGCLAAWRDGRRGHADYSGARAALQC